MTISDQWGITIRALGILVAYVSGAVILHPFISGWVGTGSWWFSLPLSLAIAQVCALAMLLTVLFLAKFRRQLHQRRAVRFESTVRDLLSDHVAGGENLEALAKLSRHHRFLIERCLVDSLFFVRGEGKRRLALVAEALGFLSDWEKQANSLSAAKRRHAVSALAETGSPEAAICLRAALTDRDGQVRLTAARSLARNSSAGAKEIFSYAMTQPLLIRALLADELKKHAAFIAAADCLPPREHRPELLAGLEIMLSWRRSIQIPRLDEMLSDPDSEIAEAALRILPYAGNPETQETQLVSALARPESAVRATAAAMLGRLQICSATPGLTKGLLDPDGAVVYSCASAIAELGPECWPLLESEVLAGSARAGVALEALETAQSGRIAMARGS